MSDFQEFSLPPKKKAKQADRGKVFEGDLKKRFEAETKLRASFDFERIPDAHSTRGALSSPRVGDFLLFNRGVCTVLEAKEVAHDYRLPSGNVKSDQRARMRRRSLAGIRCLVCVSHTTNSTYRLIPSAWFDGAPVASWDLSGHKILTFEELMKELLC